MDDKLQRLINEKKAGRKFQERKHKDWNDNYELYRNKVKTNRLTQRQAVNIPLMKETIKTLLSRVDDAPIVKWKEKSGDMTKDLIYQEMWDSNYKKNKIEWLDILDKKNVFLYGLSTKKLNLGEQAITVEVEDVFDIIYDPATNPMDIESARFIVHQNIFKPLREVLVDKRYDEKGIEKLKQWVASEKGIIQSGKNREEYEKKLERLVAMGVDSDKFNTFAAGDVLISITEHYYNHWDKDRFVRYVAIYADDCIELLCKPLKELIGIELYPFVVWSEDPETNDIYPDGVADLVRTPNKILNVWFSQQVENRTLQNFQMHWYDATNPGYIPQTYEPGPGRMLPAPGDPNKTIMPVQVNGLDESFNAINFLTNIVERGTGATAIDKGVPESGQQTLGEVKILTSNSVERAKTMTKFYQGSWHELAMKWDMMMQANSFKKVKLYKTGPSGKIYEKVVYPSDWKSKAGYEVTVASSSEHESEEIKELQKFQAVLQQFPNNNALKKILQSRELRLLDLTPQELKEVEEEEKKMVQQGAPQMGQPQVPSPQINQIPQLMQ